MNIFKSYGQELAYSFHNFLGGFASIAPKIIVAVVFFILGWIIANIVARAIEQVIGATKVDKALESAGAKAALNKAGLGLNTGKFVGWLVKWFLIIVFLVTALNYLQITPVTSFLIQSVLGYLPNVLIGILILIIATVLADFVGKVVTASAKASNVRVAGLLGTLTRYTIWIFAFIIALTEFLSPLDSGVVSQYLNTLFTGLVAMLALGGALAFGLGGKEAASDIIAKLRTRVRPSDHMTKM